MRGNRVPLPFLRRTFSTFYILKFRVQSLSTQSSPSFLHRQDTAQSPQKIGLYTRAQIHTHNRFYDPFSGTTRVSWCQKKSSSVFSMVQWKITEADTPIIQLGTTPSRLISDPPPSPPIFTLDALPAATLSLHPGLGLAPNKLACIPSDMVLYTYAQINTYFCFNGLFWSYSRTDHATKREFLGVSGESLGIPAAG